jgi:hypothetical protein
VQTCHDGGGFNAGDTITLASGPITATSKVTLTKYTKLVGAGAGSVQGSSTSSVAVGTGTKVFTIRTGTAITGWTAGQTITAHFKAKATIYMTGTVTSWSAPTLTLNITSTGGSGTYPAWTFEVPGDTVVAHNNGASAILEVDESTAGHTEISGIHFTRSTFGTSGDIVQMYSVASGKAIIFHDVRFTHDGGSGTTARIAMNRGLFYHIYMDCGFDWESSAIDQCAIGNISVVFGDENNASWTTVSTMGTADTTGESNFYVEDSYFAGFTQAAFDYSENSRSVTRYSVFDNAAMGDHGQDSGLAGIRHKEIYNNIFIFDNLDGLHPSWPSATYVAALNDWIQWRGGTGAIHDNTFDDISSSSYGDKVEQKFQIFNLHYNGAHFTSYSCWGQGIPGNQIPYPRQEGYGYVTGSGNSGEGGYQGDLEPIYIWSNTAHVVGAEDYPSNPCGAGVDDAANYIRLNTEYYKSDDSTAAKPGYTPYPHPHTLRDGGGGGSNPAGNNKGRARSGGTLPPRRVR